MIWLCGFTNFMVHKESPGDIHNIRFLLHLLDSDSNAGNQGLRICISNKISGDAGSDGHTYYILSDNGLGHKIHLNFENDILCVFSFQYITLSNQ